MTDTNNEFLADVWAGLSGHPKTLPSKYFYDQQGDRLFQDIMHLDEYYLTNAEHEIFNTHKDTILDMCRANDQAFRLLEFGAGDGYKTKVLLRHFTDAGAQFEYKPIDISAHALEQLAKNLRKELPSLRLTPEQGDYFNVLQRLPRENQLRNVILFLGSNIGNFTPHQAHSFLSGIRQKLYPGDLLLLGADLKKNPDTILQAYNDSRGITRQFNLNLLKRINNELNGNFELENFKHYPFYNPINGECTSTLLSLKTQQVTVQGRSFGLEKWEAIHTEISRKYSLSELEKMAQACSFDIATHLHDSHHYFVDTIWKAV